MPDSLARVEGMEFLTEAERRTLNQIRGNAYLYIFGLVEEFILPFVMDQARPMLQGDVWRVRALITFAGEEAKHIQLFKRFREEFEKGFGTRCEVIGPPDEIARAVEGYLEKGGMLDAGLMQQTAFDMHAFERATGSCRARGRSSRASQRPSAKAGRAGSEWIDHVSPRGARAVGRAGGGLPRRDQVVESDVGRPERGDGRLVWRCGRREERMKKVSIGIGVLILALGAATLMRTGQNADKLPKCSGQLCHSVGCSPDTLCARGASVVTCAEVCGGH